MPGQGVTSMFNMGYGLGVLHCALTATKIGRVDVLPTRWKKAFGLSSAKHVSLAHVQKCWPEHNRLFKLKKHEGRAEAALIGYYGVTRNV